jgi:hypothetical protein
MHSCLQAVASALSVRKPTGQHGLCALLHVRHYCVAFAPAGRLRPGRRHVSLMRHIFSRIVQELWHALVYAFVLLALCLSWFIGITRFWDNVSAVEVNSR